MLIVNKLCKAKFNEIAGQTFNWPEVFEVIAWMQNPDVTKINETANFEEWVAEDIEKGAFADIDKLPEDMEEAILIHLLENDEYAVCLCRGSELYTTLMPDNDGIDARNLVHLFC